MGELVTFGWCLELVLGFMEWCYAIKFLALAYFMTLIVMNSNLLLYLQPCKGLSLSNFKGLLNEEAHLSKNEG